MDDQRFAGALYADPLVQSTFCELHDVVWSSSGVDPVLLELCRLRMAKLLGCPEDAAGRAEPALAAGLTEEMVASLPAWPTSPHFDDGTRACISFTEQFVIDAQGIDESSASRVRAALGDAGLVGFVSALASFEVALRSTLLFGHQRPPRGEGT